MFKAIVKFCTICKLIFKEITCILKELHYIVKIKSYFKMSSFDRYLYSTDTHRLNILFPPVEPIQQRPYLRSKQYSRRKFQIKMDVKLYKLDEVTVRVKDNYIIIEGKHEERDDEGFVTVRFTHSYILPEEYDSRTIKSYYNSCGILTITGKRIEPLQNVEVEQPIQVLLINSELDDMSEITKDDVSEIGEEAYENYNWFSKEE